MLLAFDIGNTNIKIALFDGNEISNEWRISSDIKRTADEYFSVLVSLFRDLHIETQLIEAIVLSSVVPQLTEPFVAVARQLNDRQPLVIAPDMYAKLPVTVPQSAINEIGTDLLCNALEAWCRFESSCIVVDFGTALSFTAVSDVGIIAGVAIAPGLGTALKSLCMNTAQLPAVKLDVPQSSLGMNTAESIQAGIILGYKGLVEGLVAHMKYDLVCKFHIKGDNIHVIATGGLNSTLKPVIGGFDQFDQELTIKGLQRAAGFAGL